MHFSTNKYFLAAHEDRLCVHTRYNSHEMVRKWRPAPFIQVYLSLNFQHLVGGYKTNINMHHKVRIMHQQKAQLLSCLSGLELFRLGKNIVKELQLKNPRSASKTI